MSSGAGLEMSGSTSSSLIARVKQHDAAAWTRLARLYSPLAYSWSPRAGLQASDAADVGTAYIAR